MHIAKRSTRDLYCEPFRPVHPDCNTLATPNQFKQKRLPDFEGGRLGLRQRAMIFGDFLEKKAKLPVFCGLDRTRTCDLADVNGAF